MTPLARNLEQVKGAIAQACRRAGRSASDVELMAVSKTYPASTIAEAEALGLRLFGENRVQEFAAKASELAPLRSDGSIAASDVPIVVHLIGHLQSNKAARAVELFDAVDSVDSVRLAERLNEAAAKMRKRLPILIEVKLSPEETKAGLDPESSEAATLLETLPHLAHLETRGPAQDSQGRSSRSHQRSRAGRHGRPRRHRLSTRSPREPTVRDRPNSFLVRHGGERVWRAWEKGSPGLGGRRQRLPSISGRVERSTGVPSGHFRHTATNSAGHRRRSIWIAMKPSSVKRQS